MQTREKCCDLGEEGSGPARGALDEVPLGLRRTEAGKGAGTPGGGRRTLDTREQDVRLEGGGALSLEPEGQCERTREGGRWGPGQLRSSLPTG